MAAGVSVERSAHETTIVGAAYRLRIPDGEDHALFSDADGAEWTRLSLIASADRAGAVDESSGTLRARVEQDASAACARVVIAQASSAWDSKSLVIDCDPQRIRVHVEITGSGALSSVTLLGGRAILPSGACGVFRSSIRFASVFVPTPTEPVAFVRTPAAGARLGVVGDAAPGRLNAVFSPPPLALAFGRRPPVGPAELPSAAAEGDRAAEWLAVQVLAPLDACGFTGVAYDPLDGGFLLRLDYEEHTEAAGSWSSPEIALRPVRTPLEALHDYRAALRERGWAPDLSNAARPAWWTAPIFCGWGAQCAAAQHASTEQGTEVAAPSLSTRTRYDAWLDRLASRGIDPKTVVIDDRWQAEYGAATVDERAWPQLREWIAAQHARGRRVLLWFKAWDPAGVPGELCIRDRDGQPVSVDPGHPGYLGFLADRIRALIGPEGLDADGFKVDFTQRAPSGASLTGSAAASRGVWGLTALHRLLEAIAGAARSVKPDAVIIAHTVHPSFAEVVDVVRLNDMLERDAEGRPVPIVDQARMRRAIVDATLPGHPIDTDQWPMPDRASWAAYVQEQPSLGIPALYYVDAIDGTGEPIEDADLDRVAESWNRYASAGQESAEAHAGRATGEAEEARGAGPEGSGNA